MEVIQATKSNAADKKPRQRSIGQLTKTTGQRPLQHQLLFCNQNNSTPAPLILSPNTLLFTPQIPFPNPSSPTTALTTFRPHAAQSIRQPSYSNVPRRWTQTSPEAPATSPMPLCEHNISTIRIPGPPVPQSFAPHENGPRHHNKPSAMSREHPSKSSAVASIPLNA